MTPERAYWVERDALGQFRVTNTEQSLKLYNGYRNEAEAQFDADRLSDAYSAGLAARDAEVAACRAALEEVGYTGSLPEGEYDRQRAEVARWKKCCEDMAPAETVRALNAEVARLTRRVEELEAALPDEGDRPNEYERFSFELTADQIKAAKSVLDKASDYYESTGTKGIVVAQIHRRETFGGDVVHYAAGAFVEHAYAVRLVRAVHGTQAAPTEGGTT